MTPERWQRVKELFEEALERGPAERAALLAQARADDEEVGREVESLLAAHERDSGFMNTPVVKLVADEGQVLAAGQRFGQYEAIRLLGAGGMGEVYLAADTRLGRKVALKLLPSSHTGDEERVRRFGREARAASALNHPNIVTIHEIGEADSLHYIATEYIEGVTLREHMANRRMPVGEVLEVGAQVASALAAAHEVGVVHRDVKPENVMLRPDGFVKVLDFGLAKLAPQQAALASQAATDSRVKTNPGVVMGTVAYMSPEQARGLDVDARTDIWSLGVLLYEMVTGRAPFAGETPSHVLVSVMEREPPPLSPDAGTPAELEQIMSRALQKERDERYRTAREMADALKNLKEELEVAARLKREPPPRANGREYTAQSDGLRAGWAFREPAARTGHVIPARPTASVESVVGGIRRHKPYAAAALLALLAGAVVLTHFALNRYKSDSAAGGKKSLAVLPLRPIDAARRDELYELGIADSLIHRLSLMKGLVVRPLSATRKYADGAQDPLAAGREQRVDYVLTSNYQLADGKIRVTAQLVNVASGQIEETTLVEREAGDIFATQDAVAGEVVGLLRKRSVNASDVPAAKRGTNNEEAYRLYLQGKNLTMRRNAADAKKAVEYFEQAIRLDPNYASAYAGIANAYSKGKLSNDGTARVENEKARENINKALALDNNLAEAYVARADLALLVAWDFPAAERDLLRAIELEPNNDAAHWLYALLLSYRGRFDEALAEIETAQAIDPGAVMYMRDRGRILYYARRYDEAIAELKRTTDLDENMGLGWLRFTYSMKGDEARAYEIFIKVQRRNNPDLVAIYQQTYAAAGWEGVRRKLLENFKLNNNLPGTGFYSMAGLAAGLGEKELAFEYLNKAVERREWWVVMVNVDPTFDPVRDDPRFAEVVRRAGLK